MAKQLELNAKQRLFVVEYLKDLDAQKAYVRAGYNTSTAHVGAFKLIKRPHIAAAIKAAMDKRADKIGISADEVLEEIRRLAMVDIGQAYDEHGALLPLSMMPPEVRRAIASIETELGTEKRGDIVKVKLWDKVASLKLLAQHLGLLRMKLEVKGRVTLEQLVMGVDEPEPELE